MFRFPWGDMHSLNLGWFLQKFNELRADWATAEENITGALDAEIQRAEDALSDVFDARDAAAASAAAAAGSASTAGTSAAAAQNSATAAGNSATLANNKASAAGLSEAAAAQSAQQAAGSASTASSAASNAAASETAAGNSASAAAASASAAGNSASAAGNSASAAAASEAAARQVEESIPEDYSTLTAEVAGIKTALQRAETFYPDSRIPTSGRINYFTNYAADNLATEMEIYAIIPAGTYANKKLSLLFTGYNSTGQTIQSTLANPNIPANFLDNGAYLYAKAIVADGIIVTKLIARSAIGAESVSTDGIAVLSENITGIRTFAIVAPSDITASVASGVRTNKGNYSRLS